MDGARLLGQMRVKRWTVAGSQGDPLLEQLGEGSLEEQGLCRHPLHPRDTVRMVPPAG